MKNKKIIIASILTLFVFGIFLFPITIATETYTTIEEREDFSCVDDTYIYSGWSYVNSGNSPLLTVGYDVDDYTLETEYYAAVFKFDLTNRPENYAKVEAVLTFKDHGMITLIPVYIADNSWNEEELTSDSTLEVDYPPTILPYSTNLHLIFGIGFVDVTYDIDITEYSEFQFISFVLATGYISSDFEEDISTIYSKEYPIESVRPKIVWTVEHEIVPQQNNEILFLIIGLAIGLIVGLVAVGVIIVLNKRKPKI